MNVEPAPLSSFLESAIGHIYAYMDGARKEDLAAARLSIAGLIWTEDRIKCGLLPAELNDLPEGKASGKGRFNLLPAYVLFRDVRRAV